MQDFLDVYMSEPSVRRNNTLVAGMGRLREQRAVMREKMLICVKKHVFRSEIGGLLGLAPQAVQVGDRVCVLHGSSVPCILREEQGKRYRLIGQGYYEDWMYGERVNWTAKEAEEFELC